MQFFWLALNVPFYLIPPSVIPLSHTSLKERPPLRISVPFLNIVLVPLRPLGHFFSFDGGSFDTDVSLPLGFFPPLPLDPLTEDLFAVTSIVRLVFCRRFTLALVLSFRGHFSLAFLIFGV